jgi:hypothetical protein
LIALSKVGGEDASNLAFSLVYIYLRIFSVLRPRIQPTGTLLGPTRRFLIVSNAIVVGFPSKIETEDETGLFRRNLFFLHSLILL